MKTGTANRLETSNCKALGPRAIRLTNQKQGGAPRSYLFHSSLAGVNIGCAFYQPQSISTDVLYVTLHKTFLTSKF